MWDDGFVDRIVDLGEIDRIPEQELKNKIDWMIPIVRDKEISNKHKIIEDKLESYPEVETFMIDPMNGTYHLKLKDFPNIDIAATPGWQADDYETLMSVPVDLYVDGYAGVKDDEIPKDYRKDQFIIDIAQQQMSEWTIGDFSLVDEVWDPARGQYINYDDLADLYYRRVVYPLYRYLAEADSHYEIEKQEGRINFGKGGGIGYQEINKGKKSTKKSKQDNSALLGGLAGLVLGIFLNR